MPGTETVFTGRQKEQVTSITKSNSNKLSNSETNQNYWSPLTSLVEELDDADIYKTSARFNIESEKEKSLKTKRKLSKTITATERQQIGEEMANTVSEMEDEMDKILADFDQINESIDKLLEQSEPESFETGKNAKVEEIPSAVFDSGATSGVATQKDAK